MTTPDIEKLRGLPQKWRKGSASIHFDEETHEARAERYYSADKLTCANELEAAGLPELLADYERLLHLLKARDTQLLEKSADVARLLSERKRLLRERGLWPNSKSLQKRLAAQQAEQPPAVSLTAGQAVEEGK